MIFVFAPSHPGYPNGKIAFPAIFLELVWSQICRPGSPRNRFIDESFYDDTTSCLSFSDYHNIFRFLRNKASKLKRFRNLAENLATPCIRVVLYMAHWPLCTLIYYNQRWASTSILMSAISDIRHRHLLFRYQKKICRTENCHSDIDIWVHSDIRNLFYLFAGFKPKVCTFKGKRFTSQPLCWSENAWMSDRGYRIRVYSDIRYNVGLCSLQSYIGSSDIKLSPISLITDIRVSAHLWL